MDILFVLLGFGLLVAGGEFLVRGAVSIAERFKISQFLIGALVIGFGSSMPELVTSLEATFAGSPGIAVGNIVGSNIANIFLVLGLAALIAPLATTDRALMADGIWVLVATLVFVFVSITTQLTIAVGLGLLSILALYVAMAWRREFPKQVDRIQAGNIETHAFTSSKAKPVENVQPVYSKARASGLILGGFVLLILGGHLVVNGAINIAQAYGISEAVIGLTIVAVGTTLPEIVTSIIAALRRHSDVVLGNVLGSCLYNILAIGGVVALVGPTEVPSEIAGFDNIVMLSAVVLLFILLYASSSLTRHHGALLFSGYGIYVWALWP